jgi:uncharacterized protein (DUF58 family)
MKLDGPVLGWALAVAAVAAGYVSYGWPGVALGVTVVVFWLLLQFNRAVRVMRVAADRPVGRVDNAVMLHSKLAAGMRLLDVLKLTRSLGQRVAEDPETFRWQDTGGDAVRVELRGGRLVAWALERSGDGTAPPQT